MILTNDFRDTIRERAHREPDFRYALLRGIFKLLLSGETATGKTMFLNYVYPTWVSRMDILLRRKRLRFAKGPKSRSQK